MSVEEKRYHGEHGDERSTPIERESAPLVRGLLGVQSVTSVVEILAHVI